MPSPRDWKTHQRELITPGALSRHGRCITLEALAQERRKVVRMVPATAHMAASIIKFPMQYFDTKGRGFCTIHLMYGENRQNQQ